MAQTNHDVLCAILFPSFRTTLNELYEYVLIINSMLLEQDPVSGNAGYCPFATCALWLMRAALSFLFRFSSTGLIARG